MSLSASLAAQVPLEIRVGGLQLFQAGVVKLDAVKPDEALATVGRNPAFDVDLYFDGHIIDSVCTCPYVVKQKSACKHIWAAILAVDGRAFAASAKGRLRLTVLGGDDDDLDDDYEEPPTPTRRYTPFAAPKTPTWKDQLTTLSRQLGAAADETRRGPSVERQPMYVVDAPASAPAGQLVLELPVRERKKNGEWGKPKPRFLSASQAAELTDPLDRQILALLGGAERGDSYFYSSASYSTGRYRVAGPLLGRRPAADRPDGPPPPPPGAAGDGVGGGRSRRRAALGPGRHRAARRQAAGARGGPAARRGDDAAGEARAAGAGPRLLGRPRRRAGRRRRLPLGDVPAQARRASPCPPPRPTICSAQLLQMPRLPRLELPEDLRYEEVALPPQPRLVVRAPKPPAAGKDLHAELTFLYDGQAVPARPQPAASTRRTGSGSSSATRPRRTAPPASWPGSACATRPTARACS